MELIAEKVKHGLSKTGINQAELAKELGISPRKLSMRLKDGDFSATELQKLSDLLSISFVIDAYNRPQDMIQAKEEQAIYYAREEALTWRIDLNPRTAKKLPGLVEELNNVISKFKRLRGK